MKGLSLGMTVADEIRYLIVSGTIKEGEKLPSERELCKTYGVQRLTLRESLQSLIRENYIYKKSRQGYYVSPKRIMNSAYLLLSTTQGYQQSDGNVLTLSFSRKETDKEIGRKMKLLIGTPIYELDRLCLQCDQPICVERLYFQVEKFPNLEAYYKPGNSVYKTLERAYGIAIKTSNQEIIPCFADPQIAHLLQIEEGELVVLRKGWELDSNETPIYYSEAFMNYQRVGFFDHGE